MNKSLVLASLVAAVALAACGKKEEAAPAAAAGRSGRVGRRRRGCARCCRCVGRGRCGRQRGFRCRRRRFGDRCRCRQARRRRQGRGRSQGRCGQGMTRPRRPPRSDRAAGGCAGKQKSRPRAAFLRPQRAPALLQLVGQHRDDALAVLAGIGCALRVEHRDDGLRPRRSSATPGTYRRRAGVGAGAEQLGEEARRGVLAGGLRVDVAHEVHAARRGRGLRP